MARPFRLFRRVGEPDWRQVAEAQYAALYDIWRTTSCPEARRLAATAIGWDARNKEPAR